jgi:signal transduction histidine kinase
MGLVLNGAAPAAAARSIELVSAVPDRLPSVDGDFKRLHQVFGNLLSNAIKFTAAGGRVEVRASVEDRMVRIDIEDSGVGIAPEFLPYIFDRFRQADSRTTRRHGGLGLGLAIARHLVEQHGGRIEPHSAGSGQGTTMTVRLPTRLDTRRNVAANVEKMPTRTTGAGLSLEG